MRALSEKTNSEQVRLQVFRKSRWTNRQVPQFDRQLIPTAIIMGMDGCFPTAYVRQPTFSNTSISGLPVPSLDKFIEKK